MTTDAPTRGAPAGAPSGTRRAGPVALRSTPLLLALWTLFVWVGRMRNLVQEPGPLLDAGRWSLAASVLFTVLGLTLLAGLAARGLGSDGSPLARASAAVTVALAGLSVVVWLVRGVDIALGDHSAAFVAVHLVLAAVSISLAGLAVLAVRARAAGRLAS